MESHPADRLLYPLVSLSRSQYQKTYAQTLRHLEQHNLLPAHAIDVAVLTLRLRQGYIIPVGEPPEDAVHSGEHWTFVCFATSLADSVWPFADRAAVLDWVNTALPLSAKQWLPGGVGRVLVDACLRRESPQHRIVSIVRQARHHYITERRSDLWISELEYWVRYCLIPESNDFNTRTSPLNRTRDGILLNPLRVTRLFRRWSNFSHMTDADIHSALMAVTGYISEARYRVLDAGTPSEFEGLLFDEACFASPVTAGFKPSIQRLALREDASLNYSRS